MDSKTCFVIMPFSRTGSCSEAEWTSVFEELIKPAVEQSELGYTCTRSKPTRGNIVRDILDQLVDSYLVIADLTDRNPNVFYELGVRHALKKRTILISQDEKDVPFDLRSYAYHVYDWKTELGRSTFRSRIRELLIDVGKYPDKPDNPVSDFLSPKINGARPPSLAEFVKQKNPTTHVDKVVVFAYYLSKFKNVDSYNVDDIDKCYLDSRVAKPTNINVVMDSAVRRGFLMPLDAKKDGKKAWAITQSGEKYVEADLKDSE